MYVDSPPVSMDQRIIGANSGSLYSSRQIRQFNAGENAGWTIERELEVYRSQG